jgi:antirestriction protein ArdC
LSARSYSSLDAHIREGVHRTMVVFADRYTKKETDAGGNEPSL